MARALHDAATDDRRPGGRPCAELAAGSLTLCVLQLPETRFVVVMNVALIGALIGGAGWY